MAEATLISFRRVKKERNDEDKRISAENLERILTTSERPGRSQQKKEIPSGVGEKESDQTGFRSQDIMRDTSLTERVLSIHYFCVRK